MEIEKNIPVKQQRHYPFKKMEENDSFFVPREQKTMKQLRAAVASAIHRTQKLFGGKFTMRTEREEDGIRVWCVEPCAQERLDDL
jgi:hypothetical protein